MKHYFILFVSAALLATGFAAEALNSRALLNGKDLSGWTSEGFVLEGDTIVSTGKGQSLVSLETFSTYTLEFDFKLTAGASGGVGIHYPGTGDAAETGVELVILDSTSEKHKGLPDLQGNGAISKLIAAKKSALKPVGEWNRQKVSLLGSAILVELNGEIILRANLDDLSHRNLPHLGARRRSGHIAFLGHGERIAFKEIKITELPPPAYTEGVLAEGYTRLFNGRNLDGWKHEGTTEWFGSNGILKHTGKKGEPAHLWTVKEYGDCVMVFDWRWSSKGAMAMQPIVLPDGSLKLGTDGTEERQEIEEQDSGIFLRGSEDAQVNLWNWSVGSGEVWGYRKNMELPAEVRASLVPKVKADRPIGEWNRVMITIKSDRLTVNINNRLVIDNAQLPGVPAKGAIGLQHHGQSLDFANLWIKEL
ncbi:MAG: DUF1080 domain-containing protein [Akkermansiaceae bacterium]|nr:DUF1080 domain-containing protein [Akkermansiaceae bacterium]